MSAQHSLRFGFAVPGAQRGPDGLWHLRWTGTAVMGILNVTPDSFSDGGRHARLDAALASARAMRDAGALMLDVGGESTRPGSEPVPAHEELDRVLPLIRALRGEGVVISVDTMKPEVAQAALEAGAARVNIGTAALEDPEWTRQIIAEHGDRVAIGLDVRGERLAARGWTREGGDLWETLGRLDTEGCARYVVTDVNKDGMLAGPNLALLQAVSARTSAPVIASGGVSTLADIAAIRELVDAGVEGAIIGSALYKGAFTLPEALDVAGRP